MRQVNYWKTFHGILNYTILDSLEGLLQAIRDGFFDDGFMLMNDQVISDNQIINYFDQGYVAYINDVPFFSSSNLVSIRFFHLNMEQIVKAMIERVERKSVKGFKIDNEFLSLESLQIMLKMSTLRTDENKKANKWNNKQLYCELSDIEKNLSNLSFLSVGMKIIISDNVDLDSSYYKRLLVVLERLDELGISLQVNFSVDKRSELEKSGVLTWHFNNLTVIIRNDYVYYSLEEYVLKEKKLNAMIEGIRESSLSPLERYMAVYNIVARFKKYCVDPNNDFNPFLSRNLKYILENNNQYIVCVGFTNLLLTLLEKVGIKGVYFGEDVDVSYEHGFTREDKPLEYVGHARVLVKLDDEQYDVHGIYVGDPTCDNAGAEYFNHALMPLDYMQLSRYLFRLNDIYLLFDVHSSEEFWEHINFILKKRQNAEEYGEKDVNDRNVVDSYHHIKVVLDSSLGVIDPEYKNIVEGSKFKTEEDYIDFLTRVGHYIVRVTNQMVSGVTQVEAFIRALKSKGNLSEEELERMKKNILSASLKREKQFFPYQIPQGDNVNPYDLEKNTSSNRFSR